MSKNADVILRKILSVVWFYVGSTQKRTFARGCMNATSEVREPKTAPIEVNSFGTETHHFCVISHFSSIIPFAVSTKNKHPRIET